MTDSTSALSSRRKTRRGSTSTANSRSSGGWIQDTKQINLAAGRGVAVREFVLRAPHGRADYLLFVDRKPVGAIEAKPEGETLTEVELQSAKYGDGLPIGVSAACAFAALSLRVPRASRMRFTNTQDPVCRSRRSSTATSTAPKGWLAGLEYPLRPPVRGPFGARIVAMLASTTATSGKCKWKRSPTSRSSCALTGSERWCRWQRVQEDVHGGDLKLPADRAC